MTSRTRSYNQQISAAPKTAAISETGSSKVHHRPISAATRTQRARVVTIVGPCAYSDATRASLNALAVVSDELAV